MIDPIIVSDYVYALPGFEGLDKISQAFQSAGLTNQREPTIPTLGRLRFNDIHTSLIKRQDIKTMRQDSLAAGICSKLLTDKLSLSENELPDIPLFVATGIVMDQLLEKKPEFLKKIFEILLIEDVLEKNLKFSRVIPPMLALETLTNAAETFAAIYGGFGGDNATFGGTSCSGFYCLDAAIDLIRNKKCSKVIVGGVNLSGINSFFTFHSFFEDTENWIESQCAVFMLLESKESYSQRSGKNGFEITSCQSYPTIPSNIDPHNIPQFQMMDPEGIPNPLVVSGAFTKDYHHLLTRKLKDRCSEVVSWFPGFGNLGAASMFMNILLATHLIDEKKQKAITCIDRDPYGRITSTTMKPLHP